jgi:hypothetical protein
MRGRGVNYDTGFLGRTRPFEPDLVARELQIIADTLNCNAIRISGDRLDRIELAAELALAAGLEVWFAPFPNDLDRDELLECFVDSARRAESLRDRGEVVLVLGCEISLFNHDFLPGAETFERIANLIAAPREPAVASALEALPRTMDEFLAAALAETRPTFSGHITYASGSWEGIDWRPFDVVAVDLYRDRNNATSYRDRLRSYFTWEKPVAITEFGCCTYRGAAEDGGLGWRVIERRTHPPQIRAGLVRDEREQAALARELLSLYEEEGVDSAFWFTFASYGLPHRRDPRHDLDLGSYGLVKILESPGGGGLPWEPKEAFDEVARFYAARNTKPRISSAT